MLRLLEDFDDLFELGYRVGDAPLGELIERALAAIERQPLREWGTLGDRATVRAEGDRLVSFFYRPHLFPGMELKLRLAHELQFHLLPRELPADAPVEIASVLESYCHLSGDLFGWEPLDEGGRFLVWIVDMSGHGVRAGLASAVLKLLVSRAPRKERVEALLTWLNRGLAGAVREDHRGVFATGFFLVLAPGGQAVYGSAGHPPALVRRADGAVERLESIDLPIGMFADTEYGSRTVALEPGDTVLLYSDGLPEAQGRDGEEFGIERIERLLAAGDGGPRRQTGAIYDEISARQDIDRLDDDVTFLAARLR